MGIRVGLTDPIGCASTLLFLDRYLRGFNCGTRNAQISPNSLAPMIGRDTQSAVNGQDAAPLARGLSAATLPAPTIRVALLIKENYAAAKVPMLPVVASDVDPSRAAE